MRDSGKVAINVIGMMLLTFLNTAISQKFLIALIRDDEKSYSGLIFILSSAAAVVVCPPSALYAVQQQRKIRLCNDLNTQLVQYCRDRDPALVAPLRQEIQHILELSNAETTKYCSCALASKVMLYILPFVNGIAFYDDVSDVVNDFFSTAVKPINYKALHIIVCLTISVIFVLNFPSFQSQQLIGKIEQLKDSCFKYLLTLNNDGGGDGGDMLGKDEVKDLYKGLMKVKSEELKAPCCLRLFREQDVGDIPLIDDDTVFLSARSA